ncbi:unnamed protein product [Ostreobium quekettii]|uniref:HTH cro/C1-type domain-containing protein n=1 Tax=Ostreobium quekettii TaxID=121088 RepID=A0A8S1J9P7_9CHLO|nr:unnamed protein product [Ostreobium quekettii]|eukprot:evm.model.scf_548.4 EVM.evm.TU.scf_548.4   scf_548:57737-60627(-)
MNLQGQDWDTVVIRKKTPKGAEAKSSAAINQARRTGGPIDTVKKYNAGTNKGTGSGAGKDARKLDEESEELHHDRVNLELKKKIQQARMAKKMTQSQLAQAINEKPNVIQEYESGRAIPNPQVLSKLSRILGVPLSNKQRVAKRSAK